MAGNETNAPRREFVPLNNREFSTFLELARGGKRWPEIARLLKRDETALRESISRLVPNVARRLTEKDKEDPQGTGSVS